MPHFHFHLRARGMIHRDIDGTELPDVTSARAHAAAVADKLMRHSGAPTRQWSLFVEDEVGKSQFDLLFVDVDASIAPNSPQMRLLFPGACSPTAVTETCRRLGEPVEPEPVDPEQSTTLPGESVALAGATQNLPSRFERAIPSPDFVPPERGGKGVGAILSIGIACAVVAPIAYYFAVGDPFASESNAPLRPNIRDAMGLASLPEPISEVSRLESAIDKKLANTEPRNAVSEKRQQAGQLSTPRAIERPAEPALTAAIAPAPASSPEQPQASPGRVMAMRPNGMDPDQIQLLLKQGQEFIAVGDLATARVVLRRAAEAGVVAAAFALAQCYDPRVLTQMHALGVAPDIREARRWYEIAGQLGSVEAVRHLEFLPPE